MSTVGGSSSSRQPSRMFSAFEKGKWREISSGEEISAAFGGTNFSWLLLHVRFSDWRHNIFSILFTRPVFGCLFFESYGIDAVEEDLCYYMAMYE